MDDNGSVERQIASVFDFLEEPDTGCEYWGVNQRHSLKVDDEEETGNQEEHKESSDDEVRIIRLCSSSIDSLMKLDP